jgi:rhamnogalacturonyl hydrolase YesR
MWRQLIDHPDSWEEASSTAMFTFAFVTGVKNGWLPEETYGPAARKAWIALVGYLTPEGDLREVCVGTGTRADAQYYYDRPRAVGDAHGQAPMLWTAAALLR